MYTIQELMVKLKVSNETIYRWIKAGKLKAIRIGGLLRVTEESLAEFLKGS